MLRQAFVAAVAALTTLPAAAQTLWGNTRAGMTMEEVTAAVPNTRLQRLPKGEEFLSAPLLELAGAQFEPSMYFKDGKLEKVSLSTKGITPKTHDGVYDQLVAALRSKYGTEVGRSINSSFIGITRELTWASNGTSIVVFNMTIGSTDAILQVTYSNSIGRDASKL